MAIEIKPVSGVEQLERWVAVHNEIRPDDPENAAQKVLLRAEERDHLDLLAYLDGEPVGTGMVAGDRESESSGSPWVEVNVLPAHRGRGVGSALLEAASDYARRHGKSGLSCEVLSDDTYSLSFIQRRGFVEYRRFDRYELELGVEEDPDPNPPPGVELHWLAERPSLLAGMYEVAAVTHPELGGHLARQAETFVEWQVYELGSPALLLHATPVAVADSHVVGYATVRTLLDEATGEMRMVCVLPQWRRRGVASALLRAQLAAVHRAGLKRLIAWVQDGGPAGLYGKLGFQPTAGAIELRGPLL